MFDESKDANAAIEELSIVLNCPIAAIPPEFLKAFLDGFDEFYRREKKQLSEAEKRQELFNNHLRQSFALIFVMFDKYTGSRKPIEDYKLLGGFFAVLAVVVEVGFTSDRFWENKVDEYLQRIQQLKTKTSSNIRSYGPFVNRLDKFIHEKRGSLGEWKIKLLRDIVGILSS